MTSEENCGERIRLDLRFPTGISSSAAIVMTV
jgi:hypothetical protein